LDILTRTDQKPIKAGIRPHKEAEWRLPFSLRAFSQWKEETIMKIRLGLPVTAAIPDGWRRTPIRGTGNGLAVLTLAVLILATTGASAPRATQQSQPQGSPSRHTFLTPATSLETGCSGDFALCLSAGRFEVEATWKTADGATGSGHPIALTSDSGYFWFFEPNNVEVAVKALNGCGINEHYWLFASGLTDVEVTMTVRDTATEETRTYFNPLGNAFQPILDTAAFGTCSASAFASIARNPEEPAGGASMNSLVRAPEALRSISAEGCATSDTVLCVNGRFQVEASWLTASGAAGPAYAVALTSESGYFWFFEPSNVELIVKSLNACSIEQGNWFFAAGMTDVAVELRVTDTYTGESHAYSNPLGSPFHPILDTAAFAFCPTPTPTPTVTPTSIPATHTPTPTHTPRPTATPTGPPGPQTYNVIASHSFAIGYYFYPYSIRIHSGDYVHWNWTRFPGHTVASGTPANPGPGGFSVPFTIRFTQPGTFPYFCKKHHETGIVIVDP
jgi:plastocyanin